MRHIMKNKVEGMPPSKAKTYTSNHDNRVSDKGARIKLTITRPKQSSLGSVDDSTTATKNLLAKLADNNNNIDNLVHDEGVNNCVKSHIEEQTKSSAKHILSNVYNNIYNPP